MLHKIIWSSLANTGLEHLYLQHGDDGILADGMVIGIEDRVAFRIRYTIHCDQQWQVRAVVLRSLEENEQNIQLTSDGLGNWTGGSGSPVPHLEGCMDVDITATTFTNTLPIRRLGLVVFEQTPKTLKVTVVSNCLAR